MEKNILNEVNRSREIMGLSQLTEAQLLTEAKYAYDIKEMNNVNKDLYDKINEKVKKKTGYTNGCPQIPGFKDLTTYFGNKKVKAAHADRNRVSVETIIVAIVANLGGGKLSKGIKKFINGLNADEPTWSFQVTTDKISVQTNSDKRILTRGRPWAAGGKVSMGDRTNNTAASSRDVIMYTNGYNLRGFASDTSSWNLTEMDDEGFMDYTSGPSDAEGPYFHLYATTFGGKQSAEGEVIPIKEKGYEATGHYETDYASGESTPDQKLVAKAVKEIGVMFPAEIAKELDVFTLKAGASANWGEGTELPESEGKGQNFTAEEGSDELKNQKLAFTRGDEFMKAVNEGLKSGGHPGFDNYEVQWVVKGQDKSSQFIDLLLDIDKDDKIKTRVIPTKISGEKSVKAGKNTIQHFEVVFTDGTF